MNAMEKALAALKQDEQIQTFLKLAKIHAVGGDEILLAREYEQILKGMGFSVQYDKAGEAFNGNCGNLIAYWEGTDPLAEPIFLSGHLDTIMTTKDLHPVIRDGAIYSDGTTILGADDRSALAAYIDAIKAIQDTNMPCGPIELIITVNEQHGLLGAQNLDLSLVRSRNGVVFDESKGDVGYILRRGGFRSSIDIVFCMPQGSAAGHIANDPINPNAFVMGTEAFRRMNLGNLDNGDTVALIGVMEGGEFASVIPGTLHMSGQVRSYRRELLDQQLALMEKVSQEEAEKCGGSAEVNIQHGYQGYEISSEDPLYQVCRGAISHLGLPYTEGQTLGGADTNYLRMLGLNCITMGNGQREIHSFNEHISVENLINIARLSIAIIANWYQSKR
ncbi:MAG: M20/M25/M40 family metallo-hydrolase [Oscillospiraceae bacterium]|nr:M20/M25/M40 family metallo-hydrolase [Oscillospiraceae bacterium]